MHNISHFDSNCCKSHLSLSKSLGSNSPLATAINNQMNSVFLLQPIAYKVHSLSTDLNRKFVQR